MSRLDTPVIDAGRSLTRDRDYLPPASNGSRYPRLAILGVVAGFSLIAFAVWRLDLLLTASTAEGLLSTLREAYRTQVPAELRMYVWMTRTILLNPYMYLGVAAVFLLEKRIPVDRAQPTFSPALWQDLTWFVADNVTFRMFGLPLLLSGLDLVFTRYAQPLQLQSPNAWPVWLRIPLWFLVVDFLYWASHLARHKIPFLWQFHAIHHSQTELNVFSDFRQHIVDRMIPPVFVFFGLRILGIDFPPAVYVTVALDWHSRIVHANLRTNFGPLKYVIVSPQFHRVHHSMEPHHRDVNIGAWFTIWDRIFGTISTNYDEYPITGIHDSEFPLERDTGVVTAARTYIRQTIYPFKVLAGRQPARVNAAENDASAPGM